MQFDPATAATADIYRLMIACITPRPIAWVSTISPRGIPNLAPFSFFSGVGANPPTVVFCPVNRRDGSRKDTLRNLESTPEFVINVVPFALAEPMNASAAELPYEESEFDRAGLTAAPACKVKPPRVQQAPVQIECVVHQILALGQGALGANMVIGRIVHIAVDDAVLTADGQIDPRKLDTIGRMGGRAYTRTSATFDLPRPQ